MAEVEVSELWLSGLVALSVFGALMWLKVVLSGCYYAYKHLIRKPFDLLNRYYHKDSWAVITGGSDGIGLEFCH